MYTFASRIRYSEVDAGGVLKLTSLIDYLQDCSTFQTEDVGWGVTRLSSEGYAWVVNAWQIEIARLPRLGERIVIGTNPYEVRGFMGLRNFFIQDEGGAYLVMANSVWSYLDIRAGRMERVPEEMTKAYGLGERMDMVYLPRKLPFPQEGETSARAPIEVHAAHLDTNKHVNNGQFIRLALAAAFGDNLPGVARLRAEYKKQAHLGDVFYPSVNRRAADGHTLVTIALNDESGATYCSTEVLILDERGAGI